MGITGVSFAAYGAFCQAVFAKVGLFEPEELELLDDDEAPPDEELDDPPEEPDEAVDEEEDVEELVEPPADEVVEVDDVEEEVDDAVWFGPGFCVWFTLPTLVTMHEPPPHVLLQELPQRPQFSASVSRSLHAPPHIEAPAAQVAVVGPVNPLQAASDSAPSDNTNKPGNELFMIGHLKWSNMHAASSVG